LGSDHKTVAKCITGTRPIALYWESLVNGKRDFTDDGKPGVVGDLCRVGFLNSRDLVDVYEATFHNLPFSHRHWWRELTNTFGKERSENSIGTLMEARPTDDYVIAASPVYIAAVEDDILAE
jgi:hypothetical protein